MKKIFWLLLLAPVLLTAQTTHKKIKALFLGNSYTYVNNLPLLIYNVALANGDTLVYDGNAIGGYSFNNHFNDALSLSKINAQAWQYVILQAQSQEPSFPPAQVRAQTLPYAIKLDSAVKHSNPCASTVFYETWGRKNGDASNCAGYPAICIYTGMQNRLKQSYKLFADTTHSIMSPAGEAFRRSIAANPALELYDADESHPAMAGSYLAACVFYEVLFQKSVLTTTYTAGLAANTVTFLQQMAHATVTDSLAIWNISRYLPWADFEIDHTSSPVYRFQSQSAGLSNTWYFGDGATAATPAATHAYMAAGSYTVSHVVKNACKKDSTSGVIVIAPTGIAAGALTAGAAGSYPNPCGNTLHIGNAAGYNDHAIIEIHSATGSLVYRSVFSETISTEAFDDGLYFITVYSGTTRHTTLFIKAVR